MRWLLFDATKRGTSRALNTASFAVEPRPVENQASPHFGSYVLNETILRAPGYERFNASMRTLTQIDAEASDLFEPAKE